MVALDRRADEEQDRGRDKEQDEPRPQTCEVHSHVEPPELRDVGTATRARTRAHYSPTKTAGRVPGSPGRAPGSAAARRRSGAGKAVARTARPGAAERAHRR